MCTLFLYLMNENVSSLAHGVWNFMRLPAKLAGKYGNIMRQRVYCDIKNCLI